MNFTQFEEEDNYYEDDFEDINSSNRVRRKSRAGSISKKQSIKSTPHVEYHSPSSNSRLPPVQSDHLEVPTRRTNLELKASASQPQLNEQRQEGSTLPSIHQKRDLRNSIDTRPQQPKPNLQQYSPSYNQLVQDGQLNQEAPKSQFRNQEFPRKQITITKPNVQSYGKLENHPNDIHINSPVLQKIKDSIASTNNTPQYSKPKIQFKKHQREKSERDANQLNLIRQEDSNSQQRFNSEEKTEILPKKKKKQGTENLLQKQRIIKVSQTPNTIIPKSQISANLRDAQQRLEQLREASPNFVKQNKREVIKLSQTHSTNHTLQEIMNFIEQTRTKLNSFQSQKSQVYQKQAQEEDDVNLAQKLHYSTVYDQNRYLRRILKQLKQKIDDLFEKHDPRFQTMRSHPKTSSFKPVTEQDQQKYKDKQMENADKLLALVLIDFTKAQEELDKVKSPTLLLDLHNQIQDFNMEIKHQEKINRKKLKTQEKLDQIIEKKQLEETPPNLTKINELQEKIAFAKDKLYEFTIREKRNKELMYQLSEQERKLKDREEKALRQAKINDSKLYEYMDDYNKGRVKYNEFKKKKDQIQQLDKQVHQYHQEIEINQKNTRRQEQINSQQIRSLKQRLREVEQFYQGSIQQVESKNEEIQILMEKLEKQQKQQEYYTDINNLCKSLLLYLILDESPNRMYSKDDQEDEMYQLTMKQIQEINERENRAALIIQKNYKMIVAQRMYKSRLERRRQLLSLEQTTFRRQSDIAIGTEASHQEEKVKNFNPQYQTDEQVRKIASKPKIMPRMKETFGNVQQI